ncbi:MAG: 50S ribosomal protein L24 [Proteobacteria bacterium]|jgi:large subunit ribosomal protein L24|nr:50S ribosomal protein L24 [Pseudomonadota bacterium]
MKIKRGDVVIILSGKERGMQGRVLRVDTKSDRVFVEGRNIVKVHRRAIAGQEAGIISKEASVHVSNVALYSEKVKRGVRVCSRYVGKDDMLYESKREALNSFSDPAAHVAKVRYCVKTGEIFK